jgi:D-glycero-alpha-D-manno-heptose 1-phosphate guanylyltransferase
VLKQAVIFCGGFGKRLLPLTKKIPKPMAMVDDKPFLYHLISQSKKKWN